MASANIRRWDKIAAQSLRDHPTVTCLGCGKKTENKPGYQNYCPSCRSERAGQQYGTDSRRASLHRALDAVLDRVYDRRAKDSLRKLVKDSKVPLKISVTRPIGYEVHQVGPGGKKTLLQKGTSTPGAKDAGVETFSLNYFKNGTYDWGEQFTGTLAQAKQFVDRQFSPEYSAMNIESKGGRVLYVKKDKGKSLSSQREIHSETNRMFGR